MSNNQYKISADTILSVSAIIIAFTSICISIWEGMETRNHNRLSVRPKLEVFFNGGKDSFGYNVINSGLGPAIITKMKISIDGNKINSAGFSGFDEFINKLDLKGIDLSHSAIDSGITIIAGSSKIIIGCKFDKTDNRDKLLTNIFKRVSIALGYVSMYNEYFKCNFP
jgi:hypothetical protein